MFAFSWRGEGKITNFFFEHCFAFDYFLNEKRRFALQQVHGNWQKYSQNVPFRRLEVHMYFKHWIIEI